MIVLLGLGDSHGDWVHRMRLVGASRVLLGVVSERDEDGGMLGPSSCGNAGRAHMMWGFRIMCWGPERGGAGQLDSEVI